jgi:hypothetical protein
MTKENLKSHPNAEAQHPTHQRQQANSTRQRLPTNARQSPILKIATSADEDRILYKGM